MNGCDKTKNKVWDENILRRETRRNIRIEMLEEIYKKYGVEGEARRFDITKRIYETQTSMSRQTGNLCANIFGLMLSLLLYFRS